MPEPNTPVLSRAFKQESLVQKVAANAVLENLERVEFESKDDYMKFIERYSDVSGFEIHGEMQAEYQFIRNN